MKIGKSLILALLINCFFVFSAMAVDYTQGDIGAANSNEVTVPTTDMATVDDVVFQASQNVRMDGVSEPTAFAHAAYHTQVELKKNGRQFAMASQSSSIWYLDIEETAIFDVAATSVAQFSNGGFLKM